MDKELQYDDAYRIAQKFRLIPDFPRDQSAVEEISDILLSLCQGRIIAGRRWCGKDQATWLYQEVRDTWDKWRGVPALRAAFRGQFGGEGAGNCPRCISGVVSLSDGRTERCSCPLGQARCPQCDESGVVFRNGRYAMCSCRLGRMLHPSVAADLNAALNSGPDVVPLDRERRDEFRSLLPPLDKALSEPAGDVKGPEMERLFHTPITEADIEREKESRRRAAASRQREGRRSNSGEDGPGNEKPEGWVI